MFFAHQQIKGGLVGVKGMITFLQFKKIEKYI